MIHPIRANPRPAAAVEARRGFTLVEMIVASLIGVIIAGATAQALSQMFRARNSSLAHQQALARADGAASRIQLDIQNVIRDADLKATRLRVVHGGVPGTERDDLLLVTRSLRPIRNEADEGAEGGEYEVQYRIGPAEGGEAVWRRVDPAHDDYQDAGGIATPIATGAEALSVQAYDGNDWFESWDSDSDGMPHALRISVTSRSDDGRTRAVARRVAAVDRVPIAPPADEAETDTTTPDATSPQTAPTTTGTTGAATGGGRTTGGGRAPTGGGQRPTTGGGGTGGGPSGGGGTGGGGNTGGGGTPRTGGGTGGGATSSGTPKSSGAGTPKGGGR